MREGERPNRTRHPRGQFYNDKGQIRGLHTTLASLKSLIGLGIGLFNGLHWPLKHSKLKVQLTHIIRSLLYVARIARTE